MTHLQAALTIGEEIVDRNPNFCLTSKCNASSPLLSKQVPVIISIGVPSIENKMAEQREREWQQSVLGKDEM